MNIIQNTPKIEEKFSVPKKFRVGPKKVGLVGFLETSGIQNNCSEDNYLAPPPRTVCLLLRRVPSFWYHRCFNSS